jgi:hypothetical protein
MSSADETAVLDFEFRANDGDDIGALDRADRRAQSGGNDHAVQHEASKGKTLRL